MDPPDEPSPSDAAMHEGMEGLIAAMKEQQPLPRMYLEGPSTVSTVPPSNDGVVDPLAAAPWQAMDAAERLASGSTVGRLVILHRLGAGGMGVVYGAYDPDLDRKVALKLLLPGSTSSNASIRLLREAQALARLSHPNVVAIHDVGTLDEQVWLAMEFVAGQTLRQWLQTPRGWRDVLGVMRQAGEGLAAAHAAGLLHRDFKPDNVMLGDDGRVRVMDFGLARTRPTITLEGLGQPSAVPTDDPMAMPVTRAGAIVGTPGYMAPEQLGRGELTSAADQFAFCVTLWEGLFGERPFGGTTASEIVANLFEERLRTPKRGAAPRWLRRACERGLSFDPERRWPSMSVLLETLAKGRARARARGALVAAGVIAGLGLAVQAQRQWELAQRVTACGTTADEIFDAWNPDRRARLREAMVATELPNAATMADKTSSILDEHVERWKEARVEVCMEAEVRDRWDTNTLERSLWCFEERRIQLGLLVDELATADPAVIQHAVGAALGLPTTDQCDDQRALERFATPPPASRDDARIVRSQIIRVATLELTGRYQAALELAHEALAHAQTVDWTPLVALARLRLGTVQAHIGALADAEATLTAAYFEAAGGAAPDLACDAAIALTYLVGHGAARPADGRHWGRLAEVELGALVDEGDLRRATLLGNLATIDEDTADYAQAKERFRQALAIRARAVGPEHLEVAEILDRLATVHYDDDEYDEAKALHERALAIREDALGPDHPDVAISLDNIAQIVLYFGAYEEAKALYERALSIREDALGPNHPSVAKSLTGLGHVSMDLERYQEAKAFYERALAIREATLEPNHPELGWNLYHLSHVYHETQERDRAMILRERALANLEQALGPTHPLLAYPLVTLAESALALDRPSDALPWIERAVALLTRDEPTNELHAARFILARARWEAPEGAGRDRAQAIELATEARAFFEQSGAGAINQYNKADRWLAAHAL